MPLNIESQSKVLMLFRIIMMNKTKEVLNGLSRALGNIDSFMIKEGKDASVSSDVIGWWDGSQPMRGEDLESARQNIGLLGSCALWQPSQPSETFTLQLQQQVRIPEYQVTLELDLTSSQAACTPFRLRKM